MNRQWLKNLTSDDKRHAMPIMTTPGFSLIGVKAGDVFLSGETQFRAVKTIVERFPATAAALTMMDLSVEAEAFGAEVRFNEHDNPDIVKPALNDLSDADTLKIPEVGSHRTGQVLLAARRCAAEISDRPTLGGLIGPFSLSGRLIDMSKMMLATMTEPEAVHRLLEKTTAFLIEYAKAFKETGCHGLIMAEPAAGLISPKMAEEFSYRYIRRIVDAVKDENFVFVLHNCGQTEKMIPQMLDTGASALHLGNAIIMTNVLGQVPETIPVMGNIDPSSVFLMGTPELVYQKTEELLNATAKFPHFVLSSGCDIPAGTPLDNLRAFFDALEAFNASKA